MSYILEALRKSEQERNPEPVPNIDTRHLHVKKDNSSKIKFWILGVILLVVNGTFIAYFVMSDKTESSTNIQPAQTVPAETVVPQAVLTNPVVQSSISIQTEEVIVSEPVKELVINATEKKEIFRTTKPLTEIERASIPDIFSMPFDFQQQIPSMAFSTHIYVSDGGSFVIINGKNLSDGMVVSQGLTLLNILSDGVVLRYNNRRFFLASMTNWQQD